MKVNLNEKSIEILEFYKKIFQTEDYDSTLIQMVINEIEYQESWDWKEDKYIDELKKLLKEVLQ